MVAGQFTGVTYTGPDGAFYTVALSAVGEIGGAPFFIPPDGEIWSWEANGPFGTSVCGRNTLLWPRHSSDADDPPRSEYRPGPVAPKVQLYGRPFMRLHIQNVGRIVSLTARATRWGREPI